MYVKFTVPISPTGKGRPKFARCGNFVKTYTPEATASAENLVKIIYQRDCEKAWFDGAFMIKIECLYDRPKCHYNSKGLVKQNAPKYCTKKPDLDNVEKLICDSLNGLAYKDDSQCVRSISYKRWADYNEKACMVVEIESME